MNAFPIKEVFKIHGGNSGLTEKVIYENQANNPENNIPVFSSATEESFYLPKVDRNLKIKGRGIKLFSKDKKYIIVARNGKAGIMNIIENINFTINDHAYIFEAKRSFIDKVNLDYFIMKYQNDFKGFVSNKDSNGTFSKEIAENYEIAIPSLRDQEGYVQERKKLLDLKSNLKNIKTKIELRTSFNIQEGTPYLIRDLFLHFQGHQLTDKQIYNNIGIYPVFSGADNSTKGFIDKPLFEDKFKLPCLIYQTKGNNEFKSRVVWELFNANNTAVLFIKKSKKDIINIEYIQLIIACNMKLSISSQEGVSYIDTKILNTEIYLPPIKEQNIIVEQIKKIRHQEECIQGLITKLDKQLEKLISIK